MRGRIGGTLFFIIHYDENFVFKFLYEQMFQSPGRGTSFLIMESGSLFNPVKP